MRRTLRFTRGILRAARTLHVTALKTAQRKSEARVLDARLDHAAAVQQAAILADKAAAVAAQEGLVQGALSAEILQTRV